MIFRTYCLAAAAASLVMLAASANAGTLPDASYFIKLNSDAPITLPGAYSSGTAYGEITSVPSPALHTHVNGVGVSIAMIQYYFKVDGPVVDTPLLMFVSVSLHYSLKGQSLAAGALWGTTAQMTVASSNSSQTRYDYNFASIDCFKPTGSVPVCPAGASQDLYTVVPIQVLSGERVRICRMACTANAPPMLRALVNLLFQPSAK